MEQAPASLVEMEDSTPKNKKQKIVEYDSSSEDESSISVAQDHSHVGSIHGQATKLVEMGCTYEQAAHAIDICGTNTDIVDLFDFIQAASYDILNEGETSTSQIHKVVDNDKCASIVDLATQLVEMGCSSEQVAHALTICGKDTDISEIFDFIQATSYASLDEGCSSKRAMDEVDSLNNEEELDFAPFQELKEMGFSSLAIKTAMEMCDSLDLDDLLKCLSEYEGDNLPVEKDPAEENDEASLVHEDSSSAQSELNHEAGLSRNLSTRASARAGPFGNQSSASVAESELNNGAGSSKKISKWATWTGDRIKLWYSYQGIQQDFFSDPDTWGKRRMGDVKAKKCQQSGPQSGEVLLPSKMMGFSIPGLFIGRPRPLPDAMAGPPYFYFENVAGTPKSEWDTMMRHFHDIDVEFTDAKFFSACHRPRGYIHNLPIHNRDRPMPEPPMTVFEALPYAREYWPTWDTREKLNCLHTARASDVLCEMIRRLFDQHGESGMPYARQQEILRACKRWNLVWVGPGQAAPLEPNEMEILLGFEKDHTRGCSAARDRYAALGNSFQVDTVAYHLSPLKALYPEGITVLSLFSGIGGAEVALHKAGVTLKAVVAVERNVKASNALTSWWRKTGQKGILRHLPDVKELTHDVLAQLVDELGRIDLVIGGSPCNQLSGCNRQSRVGLEGKDSSLFFEFPRVLNLVKRIMKQRDYIYK